MEKSVMKAAWYDQKGSAADVLVVGEQPVPVAQAGELLIRVRASGVNPSDTKARQGARGRTDMPFPLIIPHQDGAGEVVAAGSAADAAWIGKRVWFYEAQLGRPFGAAAEYVALPVRQVSELPDAASFEEGASLGVPAMTAHRSIFADGPVAGKTVFVSGGAGAVGRYAIQFAKLGGATVIASVSRDEQAQSALAAGADFIVNRKTDDIVARVREFTGKERGVDRFVEVAFGANLDVIAALLAPRGVVATYASDAVPEPALPFWPLVMLDATIRFVLVYVMDAAAHAEAQRAIAEALEAGALTHNIAARYPLDDIVAAHEFLESGKALGKVIVAS
ncbi:NADPH:quinone reductase [Sphingopyxis sp. BSN-002]|uniref:NADPH:quinone reductase n=1 Tax=Sphingopyxis sp. BSN-002 TaxID=2911495 RepID=UPI001EDBAFCA|nr:NADPH:quinone reductase [Sphingopyxis sp. BSN-002]UKK84162.1 NADPH:quinone reductase [Sphingopyxis sp. BSN-002]